MMTDQLHELITLYSLGALGQHEARALESCLKAENPEALAELSACQEIVGLLALDAPEAEPADSVRAELMAQIQEMSLTDPAANNVSSLNDVRREEGEWVSFAEKIRMKLLLKNPSDKRVTFLLRFEPGAVLPRHPHTGVEECYVLEGDFHIGEQNYGPGDYQYALPGSSHERIYTNNGALVLITAPDSYVTV